MLTHPYPHTLLKGTHICSHSNPYGCLQQIVTTCARSIVPQLIAYIDVRARLLMGTSCDLVLPVRIEKHTFPAQSSWR